MGDEDGAASSVSGSSLTPPSPFRRPEVSGGIDVDVVGIEDDGRADPVVAADGEPAPEPAASEPDLDHLFDMMGGLG